MNEIIVAFITGLTTGGLSCLAVQGGLLASSLEHQLESNLQVQSIGKKGFGKKRVKQVNMNLVLPILLFLGAKLAAYTLLGFLLGAIGSVFQLSTTLRAFLLITVGIFMIGNALRILNVHPIFRYFSIEPPKFITRYIRRTAKNGTELFSPLFLGVLTVLIPCGVTQAMMAVAITTGNPLTGATIMFSFVLGTSPVFFLVAYLTMKLGSKLEAFFMRFVAIIVLILGLVTIDGGLNLIGSPLSISYAINNSITKYYPEQTAPVSNRLRLSVENNGYFPRRLYALAGETIRLDLVTDNTFSCSRDFVIPALGIQVLLPDTGTVQVDIPPQETGTTMRFTCSMGMYTGDIYFKD
ncbi:MAG: sulfite exporter TauE/SafE family protein [Chloroflexota bacterium]